MEVDDVFFKNSLESFIVNIESMKQKINEDGLVISITFSPTPANGKTFLSGNIAQSLAEYGKKVLIVDADYKSLDLQKMFNMSKMSIDSFLNIDKDNLSKLKLKNNLYALPKVSTRLDSFEFFYNGDFKKKI